MTALNLRLAAEPAQAVDMSPLLPELLTGKSEKAIRGIRLACGPRRLPVGDLFEVSGTLGEEGLRIKGSTVRLVGIGSEMTQGTIEIQGNAGNYLGRGMKAGTLSVRGNAGHFAGNRMTGGLIEITGNAGDFTAGAAPGDPYGMAGGTLLVGGSVGDRTGDRMRRGVVVVGGDAGSYCGTRMLAGTIIVLGDVGQLPGLGMRRGTLVCVRRPIEMSATFASSGVLDIDFLSVMFKRLGARHRQLSGLRRFGPAAERWCGDLAAGGKGELLVLEGAR